MAEFTIKKALKWFTFQSDITEINTYVFLKTSSFIQTITVGFGV